MKIATFDIETNGLFPDVDKVWCAVVKDHDSGQIRTFEPSSIHLLSAHLDTYDILVGHNCIQFDFPVLKKVFGYEYKGKKIDTLLMSRMQRPSRRVPVRMGGNSAHSVEAWGHRLGHEKKRHEDWSEYSEAMLERCKHDVAIQYRIFKTLCEEGRGEGWEHAHQLNYKLHELLKQQEDYGFLVDRKRLGEAIATLNRWMVKIDKAIEPYLPLVYEIHEGKKDGKYGYVKKIFTKSGNYTKQVERWLADQSKEPSLGLDGFSRISWRRVDLDKNLEVKSFLLKEGWIPAAWNSNNEGVQTSPKLSLDDPFKGIQSSIGKLVVKRLQCRQRRGVLDGWVDAVRPDGRIPGVVAGLAATGRARHRVIVNVPKSSTFFGKTMRSLFISKPGWLLVGVDSVGNQIRQFASRMGDPLYTATVLDPDADIHSVNQERAGLSSREVAKNFYYGMIFGSGDTKAGKIVGGTAADGKALKAQFFAGMPKMAECIAQLEASWRSTAKKWYNKKFQRMEWRDGYIRGLDGRPIQVDSEHKVLVYQLQSDEAIQMSVAYCIFHKWFEQEGWVHGKDYGVVLWMHDEIQIECRSDISDRVAQLGCESIAWAGRYLSISIPHEGSSKMGHNWAETH